MNVERAMRYNPPVVDGGRLVDDIISTSITEYCPCGMCEGPIPRRTKYRRRVILIQMADGRKITVIRYCKWCLNAMAEAVFRKSELPIRKRQALRIIRRATKKAA